MNKTQVIFIGIFGLLTLVCLLISLTFFIRESFLSVLWTGKQEIFYQLYQHHQIVGGGFLALTAFLGITLVGLVKRKRWAWYFVLISFCLNFISDFISTIIAFTIAGLSAALIGFIAIMWLCLVQMRKA